MQEYEFQEREILKEQVKQLYSLAPLGFIATLMNSLIVFLVLRDTVPLPPLGIWLGAVLGVTAMRAATVAWFRRADPDTADPSAWSRRFVASLFLIGLAWGSLALFPFTFSLAHQVFIAFVLGGMAAGASSTFSKVRWGYLAYAIPALLPLALHFLILGDTFHNAMALMTLLFLLLLWRISQHNYTVNRTSLLLRFENQAMIESLKQSKEEVQALNRQLMAEIEAKQQAESELRRYQGQLEKTVEERTAHLQEAQAKLLAAKNAAEAGSLAKSEFLANMSHEMRTPLAGTLGMIKLVLDMKIGEEERALLEMARRSSQSLLRIIGDVLDFSRLEAGVMKFERKRFFVRETVKTAVEVLALSAFEKGLELSWHVDDSVNELEGDEGRLRQVLVNLIGNAVKFTEKGSVDVEVTLGKDREGGGEEVMEFAVRDTGVGIAEDQLERIFGKFTQIDSSLTRRHGGTGLGLALSRQIVEKLGGRIWAESREGVGSTFYFTLPTLPPDEGRQG